jgi:hypothetical protein
MRWVMTVCCTLVACGALAAPVALAQGTPVRPDLHGTWESRWLTPLERPPGVDALSVDKAKAVEIQAMIQKFIDGRPGHSNPDSDFDFTSLAEVNGEYRTSMIVEPADGRIPFTTEGLRLLDIADKRSNGVDNPEERLDSERCTAGNGRAPILSPPTNAYLQLVQTSDTVVILAEALNEVRIMPIGRANHGKGLGGWLGASTAHWDGDTLVVETTDFRVDDTLRIMPPNAVIMLTSKTQITERFRRISDREMLYRFTVEDPVLYTAPWSAETIYLRAEQPMFEYACHEANYSLGNILRGGRTRDANAAVKR